MGGVFDLLQSQVSERSRRVMFAREGKISEKEEKLAANEPKES